jgi:hypothetical protein
MIERISPELVTTIPASPEAGVLYISVEYATTLHLCACGCGHEVVLGISPHDWTVLWDGVTVTLDPSVGNWSFPCQSHYLIRRNRVVRAAGWSDEQIAEGRARDAARRSRAPAVSVTDPNKLVAAPGEGILRRLFGRLARR